MRHGASVRPCVSQLLGKTAGVVALRRDDDRDFSEVGA